MAKSAKWHLQGWQLLTRGRATKTSLAGGEL